MDSLDGILGRVDNQAKWEKISKGSSIKSNTGREVAGAKKNKHESTFMKPINEEVLEKFGFYRSKLESGVLEDLSCYLVVDAKGDSFSFEIKGYGIIANKDGYKFPYAATFYKIGPEGSKSSIHNRNANALELMALKVIFEKNLGNFADNLSFFNKLSDFKTLMKMYASLNSLYKKSYAECINSVNL